MPEVSGQKVRSLRLDALLSQRQLASRAAIAVETVSRIESAESREVANLTLRKLAKALEVDPEELHL